MLDGRTFCFVIQHGHHAIVFLDLQGLVANQEYTHRDLTQRKRKASVKPLPPRLHEALIFPEVKVQTLSKTERRINQ